VTPGREHRIWRGETLTAARGEGRGERRDAEAADYFSPAGEASTGDAEVTVVRTASGTFGST